MPGERPVLGEKQPREGVMTASRRSKHEGLGVRSAGHRDGHGERVPARDGDTF